MIPNCPIDANDANAHDIWGPDLASLRGKTVRRTPAPVVAEFVAVPKSVIDHNKTVTLAADVFFVDGTGFLMTVSRNIKFITAEYVATRTAKNLSIYMDRVTQVYKRAGFNVRTILMDGEFEKIKDQYVSQVHKYNQSIEKLEYDDSKKLKFQIKLSLIPALGYVALENLKQLQGKADNLKPFKEYARKDLIVDMEKVKNIIKLIKFSYQIAINKTINI